MESDQDRLQKARDEVAGYFGPSGKFVFQKPLAEGAHGGTLLFHENNDDGSFKRELVVKFSLNAKEDEMLRNEIVGLKMLRGAEHIGQILTPPCLTMNWPSELARWGGPPGIKDLDEPNEANSQFAPRPTFFMEYLALGTMAQFKTRLMDHPEFERVPNRVLWLILRCLVRSCIAMMYPPYGDPGEPLRREELMPGLLQDGLSQGSAHLENLLIGRVDPDDTEHSIFPIAKLIDFGRFMIEDTVWDAHTFNLWGLAKFMEQLAHLNVSRRIAHDPPLSVVDLELNGEEVTFETEMLMWSMEDETIDFEMRVLLCRCLVADNTDNDLLPIIIPNLETIYNYCETYINANDEEHYRTQHPHRAEIESDAHIRRFVNELVYGGALGAQAEEQSIEELIQGLPIV
ncbi:hypothetical protein F4778DRAFT_732444 [Xylariomycetidae sp. FL2044]|nr:hypothetical protein F4778DRAFT_732444 [Xylariomycetidae sp. FL2044]